MFIDGLTLEPATGKPIKVVTRKRKVIYHKVQPAGKNTDGTPRYAEISQTEGWEISQETSVVPENVEALGEPILEKDEHHVTEIVKRKVEDFRRERKPSPRQEDFE